MYISVHANTHIHIHRFVDVHMQACMNAQVYVTPSKDVCACMHVPIFLYIHNTHACTCVDMRMYVLLYVCKHADVHIVMVGCTKPRQKSLREVLSSAGYSISAVEKAIQERGTKAPRVRWQCITMCITWLYAYLHR